MRVLVTNDDGIDSAGLQVLASVAAEAGLDVVVAAPHEERSGSSASLVATRADGRLQLREERLPGLDHVRAFAVEATPAYITWAGVRGAFGTVRTWSCRGSTRVPTPVTRYCTPGPSAPRSRRTRMVSPRWRCR